MAAQLLTTHLEHISQQRVGTNFIRRQKQLLNLLQSSALCRQQNFPVSLPQKSTQGTKPLSHYDSLVNF